MNVQGVQGAKNTLHSCRPRYTLSVQGVQGVQGTYIRERKK